MRFERIIVRFGNGSHEEIPIGRVVPSGGRSDAIDLPGDRRIIQSVECGHVVWQSRVAQQATGQRLRNTLEPATLFLKKMMFCGRTRLTPPEQSSSDVSQLCPLAVT